MTVRLNSSYVPTIFVGLILSNVPVTGVGLSHPFFGQPAEEKVDTPYLGVNVKGLHTSRGEARSIIHDTLPSSYYDQSFRLFSQSGVNHVRYYIAWESYVKDPISFINELITVANTADRYGIHVIYDNHQFHTASYLNTNRGTGFPFFLFEGSSTVPTFSYDSGGSAKSESAKTWWTNWWDRSIMDANGTDGWVLMRDFLTRIVGAVDEHSSTLGYEILNEPQVHNDNQWEKVGQFNTFMVNELRKVTNKTLAFSQQIPSSINEKTISVTAENMAKMAPQDKNNVVFKFSSGYGTPTPESYFAKRLQIYFDAAKIAGIPVYIGEWNNVERERTINEEGREVWEMVPETSDLNQTDANVIVEAFKDADVWGMAFWTWDFRKNRIPNFNLFTETGAGTILPNIYFDVVVNAYRTVYDRQQAGV